MPIVEKFCVSAKAGVEPFGLTRKLMFGVMPEMVFKLLTVLKSLFHSVSCGRKASFTIFALGSSGVELNFSHFFLMVSSCFSTSPLWYEMRLQFWRFNATCEYRLKSRKSDKVSRISKRSWDVSPASFSGPCSRQQASSSLNRMPDQ